MSYRAPDDRIGEATGGRKRRAPLRGRVGARPVSILGAILKEERCHNNGFCDGQHSGQSCVHLF
jgi:hypothetical protein